MKNQKSFIKFQFVSKSGAHSILSNFEPRIKTIVLLFEEKVEMFSDVSSWQKKLK